jgi:hypothetical protein
MDRKSPLRAAYRPCHWDLESSEIPILNAFCLVAPSVRFSLFAI